MIKVLESVSYSQRLKISVFKVSKKSLWRDLITANLKGWSGFLMKSSSTFHPEM